MKKLSLFVAIAIMAMCSVSSAKALTFGESLNKGAIITSVAVGYQPGLGVALSGDYVLADTWGPGYFAAGLSLNTTGPAKNYAALPRATYGVFFTDAIEAYAGVQLGFGRNKNTGNSLVYGGLLGGRYYFSDTMSRSAFELHGRYQG